MPDLNIKVQDPTKPRKESFRKYTTREKKLPADFAEQVLNLELQLDNGNFTIDTVNKLLANYAQAVEFYNGMNDEKFTYYEARI